MCYHPAMKEHSILAFAAVASPARIILVLFLLLMPGFASAGSPAAISVGTRYHLEHGSFDELPFDDGDMSYGAAYEWHEDGGYWQVALMYTPSVGGNVGDRTTNSTDYVITPQINLLFKDGTWRGGIGVLRSYIKDKDDGAEWTDIYWQALFGVHLPMFGLEFDILLGYVFETWNDFESYAFDDMDYNVWISFSF